MNKLIVFNWKMNPLNEKRALTLALLSDFKKVVIAPPFLYIPLVKKVIKKALLGAQDVFWEKFGAYTGCISPRQLKSLGVKYVIVGHSERRYYFKENDEIINKKIKAALKENLKVILCVGEDWSVRKKGLKAAKKFVEKQLFKDLKGIKSLAVNYQPLIIAYEPIWAIGSSVADEPKETQEMVKFIKDFLAINYQLTAKVLYGGSVSSRNVFNFLSQKEIDGVLVGGASLKSKEIIKIINVTNQ